MPTRVRFTFSNMSQTLIARRAYGTNAAAWVTAPPSNLYPVASNVPHNSPLNTVQGHSGEADLNAGGSVTMIYNVGAGGTSTFTATLPPAAGAAPHINVVNTGVIGATHRTSGNEHQWDIAINFR
ncbi:hypothetical protein [Terracidiphilus gabretensis]|jgi:hypothetical protein|uniref:hypothetical protein n=1 Tax=Terracidiphilus gabretensis TaxID=1577687 RepID=UPI00071BB831|nr:hypothetical protein [Terracidiphilus gabretensis]